MSAFGIRVCAALVALMLPAMAMAADTPEEPAAVPMPRVKPTPAAPPTPPPQPRIKPAAAPAAVPPAAVVPAPVPIPRPTEAEIKAGATVGVLGYTLKDEKGPAVLRVEYLWADGKVYGLRSSPV